MRRALVAVTDSPAVVGGRTVAGGGLHAVGLAAGMDAAAVALVQAAERAVGALHEARRPAAPASVGQAETSLGQEDAASFAPRRPSSCAGSRS